MPPLFCQYNNSAGVQETGPLNNFMVIRLMSCDYENPWYFKGSLSYLRILTICTVLSTGSLIFKMVEYIG